MLWKRQYKVVIFYVFIFFFIGDYIRVMLNIKEGGDYINVNVIKVRIVCLRYWKDFFFSVVFMVVGVFLLIVVS